MRYISEKIKCPQCGRRLFDLRSGANFEVDVKCPRCKKVIGVTKSKRIIAKAK